jgi:hypothetical protein
MSLDKIHHAKERGWKTVQFPVPHTHDSEGGEVNAYALLTPSGSPVDVSEKEGYGSVWGDFSEPEAWQRLPDTL